MGDRSRNEKGMENELDFEEFYKRLQRSPGSEGWTEDNRHSRAVLEEMGYSPYQVNDIIGMFDHEPDCDIAWDVYQILHHSDEVQP